MRRIGSGIGLWSEATDELLRRFLPYVHKSRRDLAGNWSGMDSSKAERELGFRARFVWDQSG